MIHLFHKWSKWSDPSKEGCLSVQRRICSVCNISEHKITETFHDYKVEKVTETKTTSRYNGNQYLNRFTLLSCTRCFHEVSKNEDHLMVDLT